MVRIILDELVEKLLRLGQQSAALLGRADLGLGPKALGHLQIEHVAHRRRHWFFLSSVSR